jgi:hypothetical protein
MLSCIIRNQPVSSDRDISYNVAVDTIETSQVNIRDKVIDTLLSYLHVKELTGNNDGPEVEMFIASTGLDPKAGHPWCAAFISYIFQANSLSVPRYSARAAAWFDEDHIISNKNAIKADLGSLYYARLGRIGHIVMYLQPYDNPTPYVAVGEGNTNAQLSNEGNRAAKNFRPRAVIHSSANWID